MRNGKIVQLLSATALIGVAASGAFADIELIGHENVPSSFVLNYQALVNSGQTQSPPFNNIKLIFGGNVNYTVSGFNYTLSNAQQFEQVGGATPHKVIQDFSGTGSAGWAQNSPGAAATGTFPFASAAGNLVTVGQSLNFNVYFGPGVETDGTHFYLEFWNGNSFATGYEVKFKVGSMDGNTSRTGYEQVQYFTAVPLPPAVWSGLVMMVGFGAFLAKRRHDRKVLS